MSSTRRSGRAKAPVKYTSDSDSGSTFESKKKAPSKKKAAGAAATPKKRSTDAAAADKKGSSAAPTPKRQKRDPETLAAELREKAAAQEEKATAAQHKARWEEWLTAHDASGALLDAEPARDVSITQTDSGTRYGLKPAELGVLKHFEKKNPSYGNTMKIFVEEEVKKVAWRKYGMLGGEDGEDEEKVLERGEELWRKERGSPAVSEGEPVKVVAEKEEKERETGKGKPAKGKK